MRPILRSVREVLRKAWWWLRQVSGDAAYENYVRWAASRRLAARLALPGQDSGLPARDAADCGHAAVLSPEDFYVEMLKRRYARASRCC